MSDTKQLDQEESPKHDGVGAFHTTGLRRASGAKEKTRSCCHVTDGVSGATGLNAAATTIQNSIQRNSIRWSVNSPNS